MTVIISILGDDEETETIEVCDAPQLKHEEVLSTILEPRLMTVWEAIQIEEEQYSPSLLGKIRS